MNERITKILRYVKGPAVLDVGCAGGSANPDSPYWLHKYLRDRFPKVIGIDINEQAVQKLNNLGFNCLVGNAEDFQMSEQFDSIVAGELIEHLSNPGNFLKTARKHLKPDGLLVITTPYPFSAMNILDAFLKYPKTCSNPEHTMWFCPATLLQLVSRYGYTVLHWELIEDYYEGVDSLLYKIFVKLRRFIPARKLRCNAMLFVLKTK